MSLMTWHMHTRTHIPASHCQRVADVVRTAHVLVMYTLYALVHGMVFAPSRKLN